MFFGARHRALAHPAAAIATSTTGTSSPEGPTTPTFISLQPTADITITHEIDNDGGAHLSARTSDEDKTHKPLPRRLRMRALATRAAACGARAALFVGVCCGFFSWARLHAMRSVVSLASSTSRTMALVSGMDREPKMEKFTVLVNTFKRPVQLEGAIRHYATCNGIDSIRVVWSEQSPPPDPVTDPQFFQFSTPVRFQAHPTTSINNRFIPPPDLATIGVFVVDDDIAVPCGHLQAAFETWRRHSDSLVGFFPRSHEHWQEGSAANGNRRDIWEYLYFWRVLWKMEYSIVLTKAAFVHREYLELYSGVLPAEKRSVGDSRIPMLKIMADVRNYVDLHRNCEDIAMQMAITTVSGSVPVATFAPVKDIGLLGGISTGEGSGRWWQAPHAVKRSSCLADLNEIFCRHALLPASTSELPDDDDDAAKGDGQTSSSRAHQAQEQEGKEANQQEAKQRQPEQQQQRWSRRSTCEALRRTNLFAVPPQAERRNFSPTNGEKPTQAARGAGELGLRGSAIRDDVDRGVFSVGGDHGNDDGDLGRISRWALAVRAPTLAEFISADMLLVPQKMWRWLTKEDVFGRDLLI